MASATHASASPDSAMLSITGNKSRATRWSSGSAGADAAANPVNCSDHHVNRICRSAGSRPARASSPRRASSVHSAVTASRNGGATSGRTKGSVRRSMSVLWFQQAAMTSARQIILNIGVTKGGNCPQTLSPYAVRNEMGPSHIDGPNGASADHGSTGQLPDKIAA